MAQGSVSAGQAKPKGELAARIFMLAAALGVLTFIFKSCEPTRVREHAYTPSYSESNGIGPQCCTLLQFSRLQHGMSVFEVEQVLMMRGTQISSTKIDIYVTESYSWSNPDGTNIHAIFSNGKLVSKAQFGLR